jgi:hypothetical protein
MSTTIDLAQGAELHVGGTTVGVFLPETKLRQLMEERDSLQRELDEAKRELAALRGERDRYARSLLAAMWKLQPIDEATSMARIAEAQRDGLDFSESVRSRTSRWVRPGRAVMAADPAGQYQVPP